MKELVLNSDTKQATGTNALKKLHDEMYNEYQDPRKGRHPVKRDKPFFEYDEESAYISRWMNSASSSGVCSIDGILDSDIYDQQNRFVTPDKDFTVDVFLPVPKMFSDNGAAIISYDGHMKEHVLGFDLRQQSEDCYCFKALDKDRMKDVTVRKNGEWQKQQVSFGELRDLYYEVTMGYTVSAIKSATRDMKKADRSVKQNKTVSEDDKIINKVMNEGNSFGTWNQERQMGLW